MIIQTSCDNNDDNDVPEKDTSFIQESINGYLQLSVIKTIPITLITKDPALNNTGLKYDAQYEESKGFFEFNDIKLTSNFIELSYLDRSKLSVIADISNSDIVNINIITHLEKQRIKFLVDSGISFSKASKMAQRELFENFKISNTEVRESKFFNIFSESDEGAILIAIKSIIGDSNIDAMIEDFKTDGVFNDSTLNKLYSNVSRLSLKTIRDSFKERYSYTPPNFEKYIQNFKEKAVDPIYQVTIKINNNKCINAESGSIEIDIIGGTPPYAYLWSNKETSKDISNLKPGIYSVVINDSNKIQKTISDIEIIDDAESLEITGKVINITDETMGSITTTVTGGTPPYSYLWSNDSTTQNLSNINIGELFTLKVIDVNGCSFEKKFRIFETIQDIDGNIYRIISFSSTFVWMIDNLRVTKFNDGEELDFSSNGDEWKEHITNKDNTYTFFNFETKPRKNYGGYYNVNVVNSRKNICPVGWRVPGYLELNGLGRSEDECSRPRSGCVPVFAPVRSGTVSSSGFNDVDENGYWWSRDDFIYSGSETVGQYILSLPDGWDFSSEGPTWRFSGLASGLCIRCIKER